MSDTLFSQTHYLSIHYWWMMHHARKRERRARFLELEVRLEEGQGVVGVDQGVDLCVVDLEDGVGQGAGVSRKVGDRDDSIERDYEDEKDRKVTGNTNQCKFQVWNQDLAHTPFMHK